MNKTKVTLITGASRGIGLELAKLALGDGKSLVLVSRKIEDLLVVKKELENEFDGAVIQVLACDLSKVGAVLEIEKFAVKENLFVSELINNAGFGDFAEFAEEDMQKITDMIQTNVMALVQLTRVFLPEMKKNSEGRIMNLASVAAFLPGPLMSVYYATKAFVLSFSEGLYEELSGSGVTVTAVCPGPTKTGFVDKANLGSSKLFDQKIMTAAFVAKKAYLAFVKGKSVEIPGVKFKFLIASTRFAPRGILARVVKEMQSLKNS